MTFQHTELAAGRWQTMTLAEQMGNIGSEVSRAHSWEVRGVPDQREKAFDRLLELLDLTLLDPRWKGPKRREIARAREALCDTFFGGSMGGSLESWQPYFDAFALYARSKR